MKKLKQETNDTIIKDIGNLFRLNKEKRLIKDYLEIFRDITNLFEHEEQENYYKPIRVSNYWSNNYNEYQSKDDRNKTLIILDHI